jgi:hypothetical protein
MRLPAVVARITFRLERANDWSAPIVGGHTAIQPLVSFFRPLAQKRWQRAASSRDRRGAPSATRPTPMGLFPRAPASPPEEIP